MLRNYFKIAWRNLWKNKTFSFVNIFGLATGLTAFLFIALYIFDELTFDRFHKNTENIYRVILNERSAEGKETKISGAGYMVSEKGRTDIPEIKNGARIAGFGRLNISTTENKNVFYEDLWIANPGFLQTFDFKVLQGDRNTALTQPNSVIITEETALKLFNTTQVLGKTIMRNDDPAKITAVLKNFPANSHLSFNLIFSESTFMTDDFKEAAAADWKEASFTTYLSLADHADPKLVESKINNLVNANAKNAESKKSSFTLQPLKDVHFHSNNINGSLGNAGNITYIYVFSAVGLFVLLIACINYMNLTTARFTNRSKEIAVRKVTGATRRNLAVQFLSESFLVTVIALLFALLVVNILLPYFNAFTGKQLSLGIGADYRIWVGVVGISLIVGLLSGTYPAWFQSRLKPFLLLKKNIDTGKGSISLRRSLVVFQFVLSIIMIASTMIIYLQLEYVSTKDLGFKKDQLLVVDINSGKVRSDAQTIKNEFARLPQVKDVAVSSRVPGEWKNLPTVRVRTQGKNNTATSDMFFLGVDNRFVSTYEIKLLKGRDFLAGSNADSSAVMINETAAKMLSITEPSEQLIEIPSANFGGNDNMLNEPYRVKVVGIVKDFNFQSLHQPLSPMVLGFENNPVHSIDYFTVKVAGEDVSKTLGQMETILNSVDQDHLFEYHFLDKQWQLFYREDKIRETIFMITALLTILIACLGLFGLASYAAEQRTKEIGIRKVLGASVSGIVQLLSKDFIGLVLISIVIATPIAWWAMNKWLEDFAYRINISWWIFVLAGLIAVVIALLTVSYQAVKAAVANPVKSLRTE